MRKHVLGFPTRFRTNRAVQPQKMARGLKFQIQEVEGLYYVAKTKALISCVVTMRLICFFVLQICKKQVFSHDAAQNDYGQVSVHQWFSWGNFLLKITLQTEGWYSTLKLCLIFPLHSVCTPVK